MSIRVMSRIWNLPLPATSKLVALRLADAADDSGRNVFPSVNRVARDCGLARRTVQTALQSLRRSGIIVQDRGGNSELHLAALYHFDMDKLPSAANAPGAADALGGGAADARGLVQDVHGASAADAPQPSFNRPNKPSSKRGARGTRLPEDWTPSEANIEFALGHGFSAGDIAIIGQIFKNHWLSTSRNPCKTDWDRTWQNWILKEVKDGRGPKVGGDDRKRRADEYMQTIKENDDDAEPKSHLSAA